MKNVYFIGIGGIGMSNLARYFKHEGYQVAGYDRTRTPLCAQLENEGIAIHYEDNVALIPEDFRQKEETLVVRTPAVPLTHSELQYFEQGGFNMMKRAAVLGEISKDKRALCVAGTHGKTTTSTLLAHLLRQSPIDCNAFLGGISKNYQNNLLLSAKSDFAVIEADEYDRSFHHLRPYMAIITSVDPDHLDIYGTHEAYLESFAHFTSLIQEGGALVKKVGLPLKERCQASVKVYQYAGPNASQDEKAQADFYADKPTFVKGRLYFDFHYPQGCIEQMELGLPMMIHVENAVAAMA
ncbi:MAG: UDP-N-acetylmuramate--L-alanine ligase, partial [Bacteroidales bacterium]|nr:UDP-N-acetylmuramate--L-alanine ligase [Bacteroidales bacterium]